MKKIVAVIYGGDSDEWVISQKSAATVYKHLNREKYEPYMVKMMSNKWQVEITGQEPVAINRTNFSFTKGGTERCFDYAFIEIHGTPGEDGKLQGYFDMIGIPYSTCNQLASSITFNKGTCIALLKYHGIPCANSVILKEKQNISVEEVLSRVSLPCFVKPNNGGSSFGITKVIDKEKLTAAIDKAFKYDTEVMVEEFMEGRELTNGAFMHNDKAVAMSITEIIPNKEYFDFAAKYEGDSQEITPANISDELTKKVQQITLEIYEKLNLAGLVRIDYILKKEGPHVIEVNTTPGLSEASLIPQQAEHMGMTLTELFDHVIDATS